MKRIIYFLPLIFCSIIFTSCNKDDETSQAIDYEYHVHIHSPSNSVMHLSETMEIEIEFESHNGESVHHINVRIFDKTNNVEVYNKPQDAHVNEEKGVLEFKDEFVLSEANNVFANTVLLLEAKVWGAQDGEGEELESLEFEVLP